METAVVSKVPALTTLHTPRTPQRKRLLEAFGHEVTRKRPSPERTKAAIRTRGTWSGLKKTVGKAATGIENWARAKFDEGGARANARRADPNRVDALKEGKPVELETLPKRVRFEPVGEDVAITPSKPTIPIKERIELGKRGEGLFTVGEDGQVSGQVTERQLRLKEEKTGQIVTFTPMKFIETHANNKIRQMTDGSNKWTKVNGIDVLGIAKDDLPRMNIMFDDENGIEFNSKGKTDIGATIGKLREFAGSDESLQVILAFCHQYQIREIVANCLNDKDERVAFAPPPSAGWDLLTLNPDGTSTKVAERQQIGSAKIKISKTAEGNFRFDVNWVYASPLLNDADKPREANKYAFDPSLTGIR